MTKLPLHLRTSVISDKGPPYWFHGLPRWLSGKESAWQETPVPTLGQEDPLEKEMAAHSSILAWKIPWSEEPGELQSMLDMTEHTRNGFIQCNYLCRDSVSKYSHILRF